MTVSDGVFSPRNEVLKAALETAGIQDMPGNKVHEANTGVFKAEEVETTSICSTIKSFVPDVLWSASWYLAFFLVCQLAAACSPWTACLPFTVWSAFRLRLALTPEERPAVLKLVGISVVIGWFLNTFLALQPFAPIVVPSCASMPFGPDPLWMLTFWMGYSLFVDWVRPVFGAGGLCWPICIVLGAVFGPSSYLMGRSIGGLEFTDMGTYLIAVEHGLSFPFLTWLSIRLRANLQVRQPSLSHLEV